MSRRIVTGVASALVVVALAFRSGGAFASEWGVVTIACLLVVAAAIVLVARQRFGRDDLLLLGGLGGLALWQLLSVAWSTGAGVPVLEAERTCLYLSAALALLVLLTPAVVPELLAGIAAGATIVAVYALGTRLAPGTLGGAYDPSSGYQLAKPIGYWNALGLLVVFGLLLTAGIALRGPRIRAGLAAAAAVPLTAALYFTFSRGSLIALGAGLIALVALERGRLRSVCLLAAFGAAPAVAVVLASRSPALTAAGATLQTAQDEGHTLAWKLAVLALAGLGAQVGALTVADRIRMPQRVRAAAAAGLVALGCGAVVVGLVHVGGPVDGVDRVRAAFVEEPPATTTGLGRRLLSGSGNGRADYWRVAVRMVEREPVLGEGAGSFGQTWLRERPIPNEARDAHNLYLETLAELGPLGLALLVAALAAPFVALRQARARPWSAVAAAAYVAFLVHAAVDWDWEIPLLGLIALACAAALLVAAPARRPIVLRTRGRIAWIAVTGCGIAATLAVHVGNRAAADALDALAADDAAAALVDARQARSWMPWSYEPEQLVGEALLLTGTDDPAARLALRRAVELDSGQWSIWYDLALASRGAERRSSLTRARDLNPLSLEIPDLEAEISTGS